MAGELVLLKIDGLRRTEQAIQLLSEGDHLWVRGIGNILIYVNKIGEASFRMCICSVEMVAKRFTVKRLNVDSTVGQEEAYKLVRKLGARPCKIVSNKQVDEEFVQSKISSLELSYQDFINAMKNLGFPIQTNP